MVRQLTAVLFCAVNFVIASGDEFSFDAKNGSSVGARVAGGFAEEGYAPYQVALRFNRDCKKITYTSTSDLQLSTK